MNMSKDDFNKVYKEILELINTAITQYKKNKNMKVKEIEILYGLVENIEKKINSQEQFSLVALHKAAEKIN